MNPLSKENEIVFQRLWKWFIDNKITRKREPQVTSDEGCYHVDGLIGVDERHQDESFPLAAVMLEEILHHVLTTRDARTSADFSPEFLGGILQIIGKGLKKQPRDAKTNFQSLLIRELLRLIEASATNP